MGGPWGTLGHTFSLFLGTLFWITFWEASGCHFASILVPFWLHFGSFFPPFWRLGGSLAPCRDFVGNLSGSWVVFASLWAPFFGTFGLYFSMQFSAFFFHQLFEWFLAAFLVVFCKIFAPNMHQNAMCFSTLFWDCFLSFFRSLQTSILTLSPTRGCIFRILHVSRKVIKHVLICDCFWLPFCFKNASKMSLKTFQMALKYDHRLIETRPKAH